MPRCLSRWSEIPCLHPRGHGSLRLRRECSRVFGWWCKSNTRVAILVVWNICKSSSVMASSCLCAVGHSGMLVMTSPGVRALFGGGSCSMFWMSSGGPISIHPLVCLMTQSVWSDIFVQFVSPAEQEAYPANDPHHIVIHPAGPDVLQDGRYGAQLQHEPHDSFERLGAGVL